MPFNGLTVVDPTTGQEYIARLEDLRTTVRRPPSLQNPAQVNASTQQIQVAAGGSVVAVGAATFRYLLVIQNSPSSPFNVAVNFNAQSFGGGLILKPGALIGFDIPGTVPTNQAWAAGDPAGAGNATLLIMTV